MKQKAWRKEKDLLGEKQIPAELLYGIHTARALENFPLSGRRLNPGMIHAFGAVKKACLEVNFELGFFSQQKYDALSQACDELSSGALDDQIVVDAMQGGAGTSTNMNVNEVLANRGLILMNHAPGAYGELDPIEDVNLHQSTNDTYPSALKLAAIVKLRTLERNLINLLENLQNLEKEYAHVVKIARTQLQDAVLTTMGRTMSAFADAIARDRWRIYKCEERLRVINLGGTAIGTGIGAPRSYIFKVVERLKLNTGIGFSRAENLIDNTQNSDVFSEVSGILSAAAGNLIKISNDLRLMSSGPECGFNELKLPPVQSGSSLMPSKVNPVIAEAVIQAGLKVISNHQTIATACSMGNMELNAFLPVIADSLLESLDLLSNAAGILRSRCLKGLMVDEETCQKNVESSSVLLTALASKIGYAKAEELGKKSGVSGRPIRSLVIESGLMTEVEFDRLISPEEVNRLGNKSRKQE